MREGMTMVFRLTREDYLPVERCDVVYWNNGNVRLHRTTVGRWIDLGRAYVKENWAKWARQHGVDFRDEIPD